MQKGFTTFMKTERGFSPILIILLIALAVGGYFIYKNQQKPALVPQQTTQPTSTSSAETADWKTFQDLPHGIIFKYPSNWTVAINTTSEVNPNGGAINVKGKEGLITIQWGSGFGAGCPQHKNYQTKNGNVDGCPGLNSGSFDLFPKASKVNNVLVEVKLDSNIFSTEPIINTFLKDLEIN